MNAAIAYVETDEDCVELHRFLCVISQPALFAPIDANASMAEVVRVRDEGISLVARIDGEIVGALGLIATAFWYNPQARFFTDRWFFVYPVLKNTGVGSQLLAEAAAVAYEAKMPLIINGKIKRRAKMLGDGIHFTQPSVIPPQPLTREPAPDALRH